MNSFRKPRIAIMGEFSSGKSTLCNLLLGARPLLEKVTATQLPPVWLSYGSDPAYVEGLDGIRHPLNIADLGSVPLEGTEHVRIFVRSDLLKHCDLIDMPGISDPSMSPEVWERMAHLADGVLWCTHATQAWRQSESGVWATFPEEMRPSSLLLVTRFDKIVGESDRKRVMKRVASETEGLFAGIYPISLTQAMAAGDDEQKWEASGGLAFAEALFDLTSTLSRSRNLAQAVAEEVTEDDTDAPSDAESGSIATHFRRLSAMRDTPVVTVVPRRVMARGARAQDAERKPRPTLAEARPSATVVSFSERAAAASTDDGTNGSSRSA
ncbi:dynamin family protein [Tabrizicola sp.]|uniref:dynamin family protein n=1 Tax=Tabrizicola sp. TaxID=2005166 RepID=UPI00286B36ED|nr:dynamin family protein [Tabrizicola sp.]